MNGSSIAFLREESFARAYGRDLVASVVVFLVALPLCLGIAIASRMPPAAGLITGVIGGIVVGAMSGSPLQVSGPAAGLSVMVYDIVQKFGIQSVGIIVLIGGMVQLAAGSLRLGRWFRAVSPAVIHGMLAGIGVLIFASQFHVMVDDSPKGSGIRNLMSLPAAVWKGVTPMDHTSHHLAAIIGLCTIVVLIIWKAAAPGRLKAIPAPLVAVVTGTGLAAVLSLEVNHVSLPANMLEAIRLPSLASLSGLLKSEYLIAGLALGFVASAETLLSANAVDQMHRGPRTRYDKELAAQG